MHCHVDVIEKPIDETALRASASAILRVTGMGCTNCANRVRNSLVRVPGVLDAQVTVEDGLARVHFDSEHTEIHRLLDAVADAGVGCHHDYHATLVEAAW